MYNRSTFQNAGQQLIDPYTNQILQNNQYLFEDQIQRQRQQQQMRYQSMQQLISNQNVILNQLLYQQGIHPQQQIQQQRKPYQIQLKSITLKPLEYYSQQMSSIHYPYQQPFPQPQSVQIPSREVQSRTHGFKQNAAQRTIEIQTDDQITEYDKFLRMGLGNTINQQKINDGWGPSEKEQNEFVDQKYQGDFNLQIEKDKALKELEQQQQQYQRKRFKPPGMTKEQWAKINFKLFRDQFIFIALLFYRIRKSLDIRKQAALNIKGEQAIKCMQNFLDIFKKISVKAMNQFYSNRENLNISDKRKILEDEMKKRIQHIKIQTKKIFQTLTTFNFKEITPETIEFLGSIIHDFEFPVQNFNFQFEVNRFKYSQFGQLKDVSSIEMQCYLITLLLIRVFLFRVILKPWVEFPDRIKKKELFEANCYVVSSLIYEIMMDYVKQRWLKKIGNQTHLPAKYKTLFRQLGPLLAERYQLPEDITEVRQMRQLEEPLIMGLIQREDLKSILENDKQFCQEMETFLVTWSQSLYQLVHQAYLIKKKKIRDERLEKKLLYIDKMFYSNQDDREKYTQIAKSIYDKYESILPQPAAVQQ